MMLTEIPDFESSVDLSKVYFVGWIESTVEIDERKTIFGKEYIYRLGETPAIVYIEIETGGEPQIKRFTFGKRNYDITERTKEKYKELLAQSVESDNKAKKLYGWFKEQLNHVKSN